MVIPKEFEYGKCHQNLAIYIPTEKDGDCAWTCTKDWEVPTLPECEEQ